MNEDLKRPIWPLLCAGLAFVQLLLAGAAKFMTVQRAGCEGLGGPFGCSVLFRPRLASLGPVGVADLALLGALAALVAGFALFARAGRGPETRVVALVFAGAAGFAVGIQPLSWLAGGALCPLCLAITAFSVALAAVAGVGARRHTLLPGLWLAGAFCGLLVLALGWSLVRADTVRKQDGLRREAVATVGGASGPRVVLVTREGCPYCKALETDVLGDPAVLEILATTRGVERVGREHPLAAGLKGVPFVLIVSPGGEVVASLPGYPRDVGEYAAELAAAVGQASGP